MTIRVETLHLTSPANASDLTTLGPVLDEFVGNMFPGSWIAVRAISTGDHPHLTQDQLVDRILAHGTDRYDPLRKGVHHDIDVQFAIELHATPMIYGDVMHCPHYVDRMPDHGSVFRCILDDFNHGAVIDRGYSVRIDTLLIYNLDHLRPAPILWVDNEPTFTDAPKDPRRSCAFQFRSPDARKTALLGIVKILT